MLKKFLMYAHFTDRAQKVLDLSEEEAQRYNHEYVGTEHLLLGLVKEHCGVAAAVLKQLEIEPEKIRIELERILIPAAPVSAQTPKELLLTPRARNVLAHSIDEARNLAHPYIGTEHLLLGLIREEHGIAAQVLLHFGLTAEKVRQTIKAHRGDKTS